MGNTRLELLSVVLASVLVTVMFSQSLPISAQVASVVIPVGSSDSGSGKSYEPQKVVVEVGTTVTWTNTDTEGHTVTSGSPDRTGAGAEFNSGFPLIPPGEEFQHTFDRAGEFPYFCLVHPWQKGKVIVQGEAGSGNRIRLSSPLGPPGASITIEGTDFTPGFPLTIRFDDKIMETDPAEVVADNTSTFTARITIPETAPEGEHQISVRDPSGSSASVTFSVVIGQQEEDQEAREGDSMDIGEPMDKTADDEAAAITVSPPNVTSGLRVTVNGAGFAPEWGIIVNMDGNLVANAETNEEGSFSTSFVLPSNVKAGKHNITASDGVRIASSTLNVRETASVTPKFVLSEPQLVDQSGKQVATPSAGMQILFRSEVNNNLAADQDFTYIVKIMDSENSTVMISWMEGTISASKKYRVAQSWLVEEPGRYTAQVFLWKSISDPVVLAPMKRVDFMVQ